jgi:hypothetical protein
VDYAAHGKPLSLCQVNQLRCLFETVLGSNSVRLVTPLTPLPEVGRRGIRMAREAGLVDSMPTVVVLTARVQDRDGAEPVPLGTRVRAPGCGSCSPMTCGPALTRRDFRAVGPRVHLRLADRAPSPTRDYERHPGRVRGHDPLAGISTVTHGIAHGHPPTRQERRTFSTGRSSFLNTF